MAAHTPVLDVPVALKATADNAVSVRGGYLGCRGWRIWTGKHNFGHPPIVVHVCHTPPARRIFAEMCKAAGWHRDDNTGQVFDNTVTCLSCDICPPRLSLPVQWLSMIWPQHEGMIICRIYCAVDTENATILSREHRTTRNMYLYTRRNLIFSQSPFRVVQRLGSDRTFNSRRHSAVNQ